jgi:SCF-associated factor 1
MLWEENRRMDGQTDTDPISTRGSDNKPPTIQCHVWEIEYNPIRVNPLPDDLPLSEEDAQKGVSVKLVKIAAMEHSIIGLTNYGHVLRYDELRNEANALVGYWTYVCFLFYL